MVDPLADVVALLQPAARFSKHIVGAGAWEVRRSGAGEPFYCAVLEGGCRFALDGRDPITLQAGDFLLVPATFGMSMSSLATPTTPTAPPVELAPGLFRIGALEGPHDLRILAGHCNFASPDAALLVSLIPDLIHVRDQRRLTILVKLLSEESREDRPARDVVLAHFLEVLLIEALRSTAGTAASAGLLRALCDPRLAAALRAMHTHSTRHWTVAELAKEAALSRSTFFERFNHALGMTPMEYLLAWRMARAKDLLGRDEFSVAEVAERVGYSSASTFSVAFTRHVGCVPTHYARSRKTPRRARSGRRAAAPAG